MAPNGLMKIRVTKGNCVYGDVMANVKKDRYRYLICIKIDNYEN
jgi:hypothetical protein